MQAVARVMVALLIVAVSVCTSVAAVPLSFTAQGRLTDSSGVPLPTNSYTFTFRIYDGPISVNLLWPDPSGETQPVTTNADGLWTESVGLYKPIPDSVFEGEDCYLEITVDDLINPPVTLPRVRMLTGPYAFRVQTLDGASGGNITSAVSIGPGHTFTGVDAFIAGSANEASDSVATVSGGRFNSASGYASAIGGGAFNRASGMFSTISGGGGVNASDSNRAAGLGAAVGGGARNRANLSYSTVAGGSGNISSGENSAIGGGMNNAVLNSAATVGGGHQNTVLGAYSTISGGRLNYARGDYAVVSGGGGLVYADSNSAGGDYAAVGGGTQNAASGNYATISGGESNTASGDNASVCGGSGGTASGSSSTVAGGVGNHTAAGTTFIGNGTRNTVDGGGAVIVGGYENYADGFDTFVGCGTSDSATGNRAVIVGGRYNKATADYAVIPGGLSNVAGGSYSFAAGRRAKANHSGAFVWGDSFDGDVASSAANEFTARTSGGARFFSNTALTAGVTLAPGGGAWGTVSDSTLKENIRPVSGAELLEKIAELEISRWNYETQDPSIEHIGPIAQDFYRLFGVGDNDRTITTVDPDGIALAAIKELNARNAELEARVEELTRLVDQLVRQR